ncbi:aminoglycoside phosphotransferase family protein [Pseudoclavibacter terrae]|uniref:aminoglycoside phosphotransferase family protein n=1 Tax=Pseudoclavibacter terrae TaxID=1530195 RepID=UPI00142F24AC|nr:aminoglycoside phosphotransferase family protein [Pseudoclavibacter terrae]
MLIPDDLVRRLSGRPADITDDGDAWLRRLPSLIDERLDAWDLAVAGDACNGHNAIVIPVTRRGEPHMLKLSWPHREAASEHLGLRHWNGAGIVRLAAAHPADFALLLEPLDSDRDLHAIETDDACLVIGGLLRRLNVAPPHSVPDFRAEARGWIEPLRAHPPSVPRRWVDRALDTFDSRPYDQKLLHLDLHYGNVLAAEREPWLAIDPKPVAGPAGFEVYPALRTRVEDYRGGSLMHAEVRSRVELICGEAGIDLDDAREWCIAHAVLNAHQVAEEGWATLVTMHLAIAKALSDI